MSASDREADGVGTQGWREAEDALVAGRWADARERYAALVADTRDPRAHEGLAQAAWWLDDAAESLGSREAAYRGFRAEGDDRGAARAAVALGYDSVLFGQGVAVARGWLGRASELLGEHVVAEAGWLAVRRAELALNVDHDAVAALAAASRAQEVGREVGDGAMVIVGQALAGLADVRVGEVAVGMDRLDAAAAAATAGDVGDLMWVGKICCWLISACQETHDLGRAEEWCARVQDLCEEHDLEPLFLVCRTQYASIRFAGGHVDEAESTLVDVLAEGERSRRLTRLDAVAQLGELRRRQGRLSEAEALLRQAGFRPAAVTSLAHTQLDAGEPSRAWATLAELLRSIPAQQVLERVDALAVAVAAAAAAGRAEDAEDAARELDQIASHVGTGAVRAHADAARARLTDAEPAVHLWQDAVRRFGAAGLAFDEADARLELAAALRRTGDGAAADEHEEAARATLAPLHPRAGRGPQAAEGLTERQTEVLVLLAEGRSNADIATRLHLSEHTVHRHVANIYRTLDLGSRAAAAAYAVRHGLLTPDGRSGT